MAFVSVPKDLNKVKTKVALNLTKRQLISFSIAGVTGLPTYWFSRKVIGNDLAIFLMIGVVMPFFFVAIFEKDGIVFEKYLGHIIRQKFLYPKIRVYRTQNFYDYLNTPIESEVRQLGKEKGSKRKKVVKKSKNTKRQQETVKARQSKKQKEEDKFKKKSA
ncbi:PrgI family protein [Acidaminobacter sp. JC074]|uniref:PrgI family protein n=1 Tax=Acidaminobacter sp. JC074 TaxID=2530199 RepID=UPI001F118C03|nr:PrgI family protein [Acidaminobacter sp. JC074]